MILFGNSNPMKKIQILAVLVIFITSGCATKKVHVSELFVPIEFVAKPLPEYKGMPHGEVYVINGKKESLEFVKKPMERGESRGARGFEKSGASCRGFRRE